MQDETLILIPFDSVCDFEMSVPFMDLDEVLTAHDVTTMAQVREKLVAFYLDTGYFDGVPEGQEACAREEADSRFDGAVVVTLGTLKDAHVLGNSLSGYNVSDDGARDNRLECVWHYCLLHAIRFIHAETVHKNPSEYPSYATEQGLHERSMTAIPKMVLSRVEDALGDAVERYDLIGFYDLDPADEARHEADTVSEASDAIKPYTRMVP